MNTEPALEAASAAATGPADAAEAVSPATAEPAADAPPPAGPVEGVQPQPHIEILKTVPLGLPTQQTAQPSAPASSPVPAAQNGSPTAVSNGTSTDGADSVPSSAGSDAASAVQKAEPNAERSGSDAAQQTSAEAPGLVDTIATLQPTEMFFLFAVGLSMVVFLIAIARRIVAKRREPIITDYRDFARSSDQFDPQQVDDTQFDDEAMDEQWTDEEQDVEFIDPQGLDDLDDQNWIEPGRTSALSEPDLKGLEPVFRILRQA